MVVIGLPLRQKRLRSRPTSALLTQPGEVVTNISSDSESAANNSESMLSSEANRHKISIQTNYQNRVICGLKMKNTGKKLKLWENINFGVKRMFLWVPKMKALF